ncbi:glycosyltransferase [Roseovarius nanhaiticus]|uniref:glycosyltransferase n=1 Tax=Roseovarius nanhaiticus TaxID=573024 RepID=UPI002492C82A|nr:glycosyltransferase [Roseovarius nanhaiticus]
MIDLLLRRLARAAQARKRAGAYRRPFDPGAARKILLLAVDHPIPQSQIFGFHHYADRFRDKWDADIREYPVEAPLDASLTKAATTICIQTYFEIPDADLAELFSAIRALNPDARLVYLDWFAPTDLRLADRVGPHVDAYVSKHLLSDRRQYGQPTFGDTTLMDYYGRAYDLPHEEQTFNVPNIFLKKLHLGPSFLTADFMLPVFERGKMPDGPRPTDLHARIAVEGTPWYSAMRGACAEAVAQLGGVRKVTGFGIRHDKFLRELRASKICFSPFGYGEVCWRDYEAILCGATLLKQDMGHVATAPDIFVPFETYVPVAWDLSDFAERVTWLLEDDAARIRIARNAFEVLHDYARSGGFVDQMASALFGAAQP